MLFGCLYVPDFPAQAAVRNTDCDFATRPVAVVDGPDSLLRVFALNDAARRYGVETGMMKLQAEAFPGILMCKRALAQEESAQAALLDCGYGVSPRVESTAPGIVLADLTGATQLLGPPRGIAANLARRAQACGLIANVGIAANPDTALHAARGFAGISVIPGGEEAVRIADLPVEVLDPSSSWEILDVLRSWGIRTLGALAALPAIPLIERLGQAGLALQQLARGDSWRELVPAEPPPRFAESLELEESIELLEPLAFVLNRLLDQVTARLQSRSLATDLVRVDLHLEIHRDRQVQNDPRGKESSIHTRALKLPVPTQDAKLLLKLLQLDLAAHPPAAPVNKIVVTAEPAHLRHTQTGLFEPLAPEPGQLEVAIARLKAVVGEWDSAGRARVGMAEIADSHRPDDFQVLRFNIEGRRTVAQECQTPSRLALRRFRPPMEAKVETGQEIPLAIVFNGGKAKIVSAAGPWRGSGQWWSGAERWRREEWDVALEGKTVSGLYRIFRDALSGHWFVEGMYD